ncbi:UNVERIFIED_CONTAM: Transcription initiation factor IIA subunit [Sesamum radiatum]|uniref:Transcription initiation factor IIA subunit n=1 Tax=Sesamum radiatum TaxID=300843 RepID=A0AAW2MY11_SESRA
MATFELYRRSTIGMCLTETLDQMVSGGVLSPELAIQVLIQFDKVVLFFPPFYVLLMIIAPLFSVTVNKWKIMKTI